MNTEDWIKNNISKIELWTQNIWDVCIPYLPDSIKTIQLKVKYKYLEIYEDMEWGKPVPNAPLAIGTATDYCILNGWWNEARSLFKLGVPIGVINEKKDSSYIYTHRRLMVNYIAKEKQWDFLRELVELNPSPYIYDRYSYFWWILCYQYMDTLEWIHEPKKYYYDLIQYNPWELIQTNSDALDIFKKWAQRERGNYWYKDQIRYINSLCTKVPDYSPIYIHWIIKNHIDPILELSEDDYMDVPMPAIDQCFTLSTSDFTPSFTIMTVFLHHIIPFYRRSKSNEVYSLYLYELQVLLKHY